MCRRFYVLTMILLVSVSGFAQDKVLQFQQSPRIKELLEKKDLSVEDGFFLACFAMSVDESVAKKETDRFMNVLREMENSGVSKPATKKQLKKISSKLKSEYLSVYVPFAFLDAALKEKKYGRYTAILMNALALEYFQVPYAIYENHKGAVVVAFPDESPVQMQVAGPGTFEGVSDDETIKVNFLKIIKSNGLINSYDQSDYESDFKKYFFVPFRNSIRKVVSLFYHGYGIIHANEKHTKSALVHLGRAYMIEPDYRNFYFYFCMLEEGYSADDYTEYMLDLMVEMGKLIKGEQELENFGNMLTSWILNEKKSDVVINKWLKYADRIPNENTSAIMKDIFLERAGMIEFNEMNFQIAMNYLGQSVLLIEPDKREKYNLGAAAQNWALQEESKIRAVIILDSLINKFPFLKDDDNVVRGMQECLLRGCVILYLEENISEADKFLNRYYEITSEKRDKMVEKELIPAVYVAMCKYYHEKNKCDIYRKKIKEAYQKHPEITNWKYLKDMESIGCY